jgi:ligand-binding sensor protein
MNKYIKVEGHTSLVRDKISGAIINVNSSEMTNARVRKKKWKEQQEELDSLRSDVAMMKTMLMKLVEEKDGSNSN